MFVEFSKWLDGYLHDHGPSAVVKGAIGLLTFASLLGAFFGSQPMMRNKQAESFLLRTTDALEIRHAEYTIVLPDGFEAVYELVGDRAPDVQLSADEEKGPDGRNAYTWRTDKVPAEISVGIRVQLK
jgi:hypothetical protein